MKDIHGWTALFHCTSAGHQQMVKFLLDNGANANCKEPVYGYTPLMEAAASGHEIIVQYLLNHGVKVDVRENTGATARTLAMKYGHMKIVGLMDLRAAPMPKVFCRGPGKYCEDLSSSDESCSTPQRQRPVRKTKGPSIHEGPQALAKITAVGIAGKKQSRCEQVPPQGYVTFSDNGSFEGEDLRFRDVTSPINEQDVESSSSRGRACLRGGSSFQCEPLLSLQDSDHAEKLSSRKQAKSYVKIKTRYGNCDSQWSQSPGKAGVSSQHCTLPNPEATTYTGPQDLATFLEQIGCLKYLQVFEEQDIDLRIFLTLTESDLKEIGITLFGPKRKMTSAIARWHSNARPPSDALELAYADRLEAEMQEMAIQLHKRCEEVEVMKGQVSQEQELRAVVESCLMERDVAWNDVQIQLQEAQAITRDAGVLPKPSLLCSCHGEAAMVGENLSAFNLPGLEGGSVSLKSLSLPELSAFLEERVGDMGMAERVSGGPCH
uniref:SAM domain-containing protein n=1 Tax=Chrysemys picta bellii TaxID=8478 RepID=A0A8C3IA20_CHRPI